MNIEETSPQSTWNNLKCASWQFLPFKLMLELARSMIRHLLLVARDEDHAALGQRRQQRLDQRRREGAALDAAARADATRLERE